MVKKTKNKDKPYKVIHQLYALLWKEMPQVLQNT